MKLLQRPVRAQRSGLPLAASSVRLELSHMGSCIVMATQVERMSFEEFFQHAWLAGDCPPPCSEGAPPPVSPGRHGLLCGASSQSGVHPVRFKQPQPYCQLSGGHLQRLIVRFEPTRHLATLRSSMCPCRHGSSFLMNNPAAPFTQMFER